MDESRRGFRLALRVPILRLRHYLVRRIRIRRSVPCEQRTKARRSIRTLTGRLRRRYERTPLECHRLRYTVVCS